MNAKDIKTVGVIGAGTMGYGITQVMAVAGYQVILSDINQEIVDGAIERIRQSLQKLVERERLSAEDADNAVLRIKGTTGVEEAAREAEFIIEAVPEKMELKKDIYAEIEKSGREEIVLATNTSTLSITELASMYSRPEQFIGMHFMNPVPLMKLVEIVRGLLTAEDTISVTRDLILAIGKDPIIVQDTPGFATSRLGVALFMEASRMLEEGVASVEDIDKAMRIGYGHRMGPFETCDLVGLDARLNNINALYESTRDLLWKPPQLLKKLVSAGYIGKKTGSQGGYYKYFGIDS